MYGKEIFFDEEMTCIRLEMKYFCEEMNALFEMSRFCLELFPVRGTRRSDAELWRSTSLVEHSLASHRSLTLLADFLRCVQCHSDVGLLRYRPLGRWKGHGHCMADALNRAMHGVTLASCPFAVEEHPLFEAFARPTWRPHFKISGCHSFVACQEGV